MFYQSCFLQLLFIEMLPEIYKKKFSTHSVHMVTKSLSVVPCCKPRMYKLVLDNCSPPGCWGCCCVAVPLGPIVLLVLVVLLRLVLSVPLCDPVLDELLEFVLLGDAAVGTL